MASKVTDDGRVTIPKWAQDQLGGPGAEVVVRRGADGAIVLEKAEVATPVPPGRFEELVGIADAGFSTEEIMAMTRGD
jgi:bifunctional DNA-binding transcriptional regulator/antitoxin component of YhaV-PrlF toxin-antitoxin module